MKNEEREIPDFDPIEKALKNLPDGVPAFSEDWFEQKPRVIAFEPRFRPFRPALVAATLLITVSIGYFAFGYIKTRTGAPPAEEPAGRPVVVLMVRGKVTVDRNGQIHPVSVGSTLRPNDRLLAESNAQADLLFPDQSLARLRGEGALRIQATGQRIRLYQEKGETFHDVARSKDRQAYEIETPTAIAGVRGTKFQIRLTGRTTEVIVSEGRVLMSPPAREGAAAFEPVEIQAAESGTISEETPKIDKKNANSADDIVIFNEMQRSHQMVDRELLEQITAIKDTSEQAEIEKIYNRPLETLVMADGRILKGVVASQSGGKLILHTTEGVIVIPVEDLVEIRYQK